MQRLMIKECRLSWQNNGPGCHRWNGNTVEKDQNATFKGLVGSPVIKTLQEIDVVASTFDDKNDQFYCCQFCLKYLEKPT